MRNTTVTFFLGKKEIPKEVADKMPILAAGGIAGAVGEVHAFDDESMFLNWAEKFTAGEKFLKLHRTLDAVREREKSDLTIASAIRKRRTDFLIKEMEELAMRSGLPVNSKELFMKATNADCDQLEGPIFDPSIIYEHINFGGAWRPLSGTIPNFRWIGFNDKASSMRVAGAGILFQHAWYKGQRFYFGGVPYMDFSDFREFGFNDLASSVALV